MKELKFEISQLAYDKIIEPMAEENKWNLSVGFGNDSVTITADDLHLNLIKNGIQKEMEYLNHIFKSIEEATPIE